jgi:hypothetical protein
MHFERQPVQATKIDKGLLSPDHLRLRAVQAFLLLVAVCGYANDTYAFRVLDLSDYDPGFGIARWDAAPHFVDGVERSLDGGLRYSLQGGSYEAYRDQFQWAAPTPTVAEFQMAVEQAFADWEAVDSASGLGTDVYFVPDFGTPAVFETVPSDLAGFFILNRGAEIDLFSDDLPVGITGSANTYGDPTADSVTLTSGIANYPATVFSGVDIVMNFGDLQIGDIQIPWQLNDFQQTLSHEIGHALALQDSDVEVDFDPFGVNTRFYDDNYDDTSSATALATLTNSFAGVIDPFDPDNSPGLMLYDVCQGTNPNDPGSCTGDPGIDTAGFYIHMESSPTSGEPRIGPQNDDFAGRQFLYPFVVPEPSSLFMAYIAGCALLQWRRQN